MGRAGRPKKKLPAKAVAAYRRGELSIKELARQAGACRQTITTRLREDHGISTPLRSSKIRIHVPEELLEKIEDGKLTATEAAHLLGCSVPSVVRRCKEAGIKLSPGRRRGEKQSMTETGRKITGEGIWFVLANGASSAALKCGDRVRLRNGWTGVAHCWTERGVMVRLDEEFRPALPGGLLANAVDAGDMDIAEVL